MRLVVDTTVFISAILKQVSSPADLLALDTVRGIPIVMPAAFTHVHMP